MSLRDGDICVLHIIDDINAVAFVVRNEYIIALQRAVMAAIENANLPINHSKTAPAVALLRDVVPFHRLLTATQRPCSRSEGIIVTCNKLECLLRPR